MLLQRARNAANHASRNRKPLERPSFKTTIDNRQQDQNLTIFFLCFTRTLFNLVYWVGFATVMAFKTHL